MPRIPLITIKSVPIAIILTAFKDTKYPYSHQIQWDKTEQTPLLCLLIVEGKG